MTSDDWRKVIDLGLALANGAELPPQDPELPALLRRMAPQVGMTRADADAALGSVPETAALVREIHRRTREGSYRLGRAFGASDALKENGDRAGARKVLEDAMAAEVVPLYRAQLQAYLDHVDDPDDT
ncbi:DUSAM domain-containing protein [Corallococcus exercitus]|uniref:DUSAM domain-containing protein n=1 Tax=Corallococcus exercitus TaxID=2316736 RepID=UPI0035D5122C